MIADKLVLANIFNNDATMAITHLRITDFRNLAAVDLAPCANGLNIIHGLNGSGKTSLLESVYYLGHGRSFRASATGRLVRHDVEKFSVYSQLVNDKSRDIPVGVERDLKGTHKLRIAEKDVSSVTEIAAYLPIRIIHSQSHQLFESGPVYRRKYLDWGLFYHSDNFLPCWRQFERILRQRNAALKDNRPKKELDIWTDELVKQAVEFDRQRRDYIQTLVPYINAAAQALLPEMSLEINYHPGWDEGQDYAAVLADCYREDYGCGYTQFGPHRADLDIKIDGILVKHFLSRGQQKLLVCAMILAQGMALAEPANRNLIYLVDDLPSELDLPNRQRLLALLSRQNAQIFITAIESHTIAELVEPETPMKVFHVEHGKVLNPSSE